MYTISMEIKSMCLQVHSHQCVTVTINTINWPLCSKIANTSQVLFVHQNKYDGGGAFNTEKRAPMPRPCSYMYNKYGIPFVLGTSPSARVILIQSL